MFCDALSFSVLTPFLVFAFVMCVFGFINYTQLGSTSEANCLLLLASLILMIYVLWIYLLVAHNLGEFKRWRKINQDIKLLTTPDYKETA